MEERDVFLDVIVDIAHAQVDRVFTYCAPEGVQLGAHVLVPFGRGNKPVEGFVLALTYKKPDFAVKPILRGLSPYPIFTPEQLELAVWMKQSYHCLLVDSLRLMIPAKLRGGRVQEKMERLVTLPEGLDAHTARKGMLTKNGRAKAPKQLEVFDQVALSRGAVPVKDILAEGAAGAVAALIKKGLLVESGQITFRRPDVGMHAAGAAPQSLTEAQRSVIEQIQPHLQQGKGAFLLHGVTGSGKTEVYIRLIRACIDMGKTAILLVPEIALTPQTMGLFRARFGDEAAVLHSRLSSGERFDEWRRIRLGQAKVAVGARSAVFAPFERLGLIVIDEEHEQSYQSESAPRYSAIEVARRRAAMSGATLLLGSATPGITGYYRAKTGAYTLLELPERVMGRPMPHIQVVDMREEFLQGNTGIFSGTLYAKLRACLQDGKQAILFLNRRGYSTFVSCRGCGHVFLCPHCDISMTYHRTEERVKCHFCNHSESLPQTCPNCNKRYVKYFGVGTQQVEEQFKDLFPDIPALRMDLDTTRTKDAHERLFSIFRSGAARVLIGTQMVAKGLDFPNVTLVGVVAADSSLHLPDYRSAERTFQLIMQVAGRAGRDKSPGAVVVQSYTPGHPSIRFAAEHDYKGYFFHELAQRRAALFPPFSLFLRVLITGGEEPPLVEESRALGAALEAAVKRALTGAYAGELLYISSTPAPVRKRQDVYRYQVLIKLLRTKHTAAALDAVYGCLDAQRKGKPVTVEVNPGELF